MGAELMGNEGKGVWGVLEGGKQVKGIIIQSTQ